MYILRGDMAEDAVNKAIKDYQEPFHAHGDVNVAEWGKRKMAFKMNHVPDGVYTLMTFNSDKTTVADVENRMTLDASVLRYMVVRLEDKVATAVES